MAKARPVVSDQHSAEFDELRRSHHNLLLVLEALAAEVDATTITAAEAFTVLAAALAAGADTSAAGTSHVPTGRELAGVKPTPLHPRRARARELVDMGVDSDF